MEASIRRPVAQSASVRRIETLLVCSVTPTLAGKLHLQPGARVRNMRTFFSPHHARIANSPPPAAPQVTSAIKANLTGASWTDDLKSRCHAPRMAQAARREGGVSLRVAGWCAFSDHDRIGGGEGSVVGGRSARRLDALRRSGTGKSSAAGSPGLFAHSAQVDNSACIHASYLAGTVTLGGMTRLWTPGWAPQRANTATAAEAVLPWCTTKAGQPQQPTPGRARSLPP